jgi:hypothetical protein
MCDFKSDRVYDISAASSASVGEKARGLRYNEFKNRRKTNSQMMA